MLRAGALLTVSITALVAARPARPCSCGWPDANAGVIGGSDGERAPPNPRIFSLSGSQDDDDEVVLVTAADLVRVPTDRRTITVVGLVQTVDLVGLQPRAPLAADVEYDLASLGDDGSARALGSPFTVDGTIDETAPAIPVVDEFEVRVRGHGLAAVQAFDGPQNCGTLEQPGRRLRFIP